MRVLMCALAAAGLAGCADLGGSMQAQYDNLAKKQCRSQSGVDQGCLARIERESRERAAERERNS